MILEILKIPLNVLAWASYRIATTPPHPPPRKEELARAPDSRALQFARVTRRPAALVANVRAATTYVLRAASLTAM